MKWNELLFIVDVIRSRLELDFSLKVFMKMSRHNMTKVLLDD